MPGWSGQRRFVLATVYGRGQTAAMIRHQSSDHRFALLKFLDVRQRDVAHHLAVSKQLVNHWYMGRQDVPAHHHAALLAYALERFVSLLKRWAREALPQDPRQRQAVLAERR